MGLESVSASEDVIGDLIIIMVLESKEPDVQGVEPGNEEC